MRKHLTGGGWGAVVTSQRADGALMALLDGGNTARTAQGNKNQFEGDLEAGNCGCPRGRQGQGTVVSGWSVWVERLGGATSPALRDCRGSNRWGSEETRMGAWPPRDAHREDGMREQGARAFLRAREL